MVDIGPLGPWSGPPDMAVPALERWHAAWERDHPELLGLAGPSFYRPEPVVVVSEARPVMVGIRPSEVRRILEAMGVQSATEAEIDLFLTRAARKEEQRLAEYRAAFRRFPTRGGHSSSDATIYDLPPFPEWMMEKPEPPPLHVDPLLITWQPK